ncbi:MAG: hypothetical protein P1R58_03870 [bacterium]|nr:hypothetical protein [bacterium]
MNSKRSIILTTLFLSALIITSCGGPPKQSLPQPPTEYYEILWADPVLVFSDTLLTIMQSQQIDSFKVEQPAELSAAAEEGLRFRIFPEACIVSVHLRNQIGGHPKELFSGQLSPGYYQLKIETSRIDPVEFQSPSYLLTAKVCDQWISRSISR